MLRNRGRGPDTHLTAASPAANPRPRLIFTATRRVQESSSLALSPSAPSRLSTTWLPGKLPRGSPALLASLLTLAAQSHQPGSFSASEEEEPRCSGLAVPDACRASGSVLAPKEKLHTNGCRRFQAHFCNDSTEATGYCPISAIINRELGATRSKAPSPAAISAKGSRPVDKAY